MSTDDLARVRAEIISRITGTQTEIASRLEISQPYWHQIVTGKREPSFQTLAKMAELAGGSLEIAFRQKKIIRK